MIPAIIGAAVAVGSAIYGGVQAAKARKAQKRLIEEQVRKNDEWYNKNYYSDYMQNADVQSGLSMLRDQLRLNTRQSAGMMAMRGGTDEARLAAQSAGNRTYADAIRGIAGQATAYKRGIDAQYQQNQQNIWGQFMNMYSQNAANANQFSQNGANAGLGLMQTSNLFSNAGKGAQTQTVAEYMKNNGYIYQDGKFVYGG